MGTNSSSDPQLFKEKIRCLVSDTTLPSKYKTIVREFLESYQSVIIAHGRDVNTCLSLFELFLTLLEKQLRSPYQFEPYHRAIRKPIDYYQFGCDFLKPLVDLSRSTTTGLDHLEKIIHQFNNRENVILFANHQTEADPQAISVLLEQHAPEFAEKLIFVAGERVTTDLLAIPFSMGRHLLCIYSKKYINTPPSQKREKQLHNKRIMALMSNLLREGGHAIYVAPSGGRDRTDVQGIVQLAPFDPQSIEMFYLMTQKANTPTHFYTLALSTYRLLPPPENIQTEIGEKRVTRGGAIHLSFGPEVDMEAIPTFTLNMSKHEKRQSRSDFLWRQMQTNYNQFPD